MKYIKPFTFIDLFAGLGGFHQALTRLGGKCVFASELRSDLRTLYEINYPGTPILGDITQHISDVPAHDVLCGGFPCQPFSQAGKRQGFNDEKDRGNLFTYICDIIAIHHPKYVFLENVSNLRGHDGGNTWTVISEKLDNLGYYVKDKIISPHEFGIPQHRKRIYIACRRKDLGDFSDFEFPIGDKSNECDIKSILDESDTNVLPLKKETREQLSVWQEFIDETIAHGDILPGFPIWAMEFGANYDYERICPARQSLKQLEGKRGKFGVVLSGSTKSEMIAKLPIYAQTGKDEEFPDWKKRYIAQNRAFYVKHKIWLDKWILKVKDYDNSHLKLEWNCGNKVVPQIDDKIVQFRASGIRVKLPTYAPALNLVGTQVPIFPWISIPGKNGEKGRYMTIKEAAAIQGMQSLKFCDARYSLPSGRCFEALGNAVNVEVVYKIAKTLFEYGK